MTQILQSKVKKEVFMKKRYILVLLILLTLLIGCTNKEPVEQTIDTGISISECRDTPLATGCYIPSDDLNHISTDPVEYLITEDFDTERVGQAPRNWLLYKNQEYKADGVRTIIAEEAGGNRYVRMYSDGLRAPAYPQSAPTPTFIFTTKFNLDIDRKGVAFGSVMIPSEVTSNAVTLGVSTGAVNAISVVIGTDRKVSVKVGGPFFYFSGSGDGGSEYATAFTLTKDIWYSFKFEWDASLNEVKAFIIIDAVETLLYSGEFHISNRVNAEVNETILVPNVFKVTMPRYSSGWAYLDDVVVERKGE
jgi:hypothetical protein